MSSRPGLTGDRRIAWQNVAHRGERGDPDRRRGVRRRLCRRLGGRQSVRPRRPTACISCGSVLPAAALRSWSRSCATRSASSRSHARLSASSRERHASAATRTSRRVHSRRTAGEEFNCLRVARHRLFARLPNFARACGRVSVGGHPDKRPDSRLRKRAHFLSSCDRQPEAKPAHPALNGGRGLKQRRSGLLWSRRPSKGRTPKRLVLLAGRAERDSPAPNQGSISGEEPFASSVSPSHGRAKPPHPLTPGAARRAHAPELQSGGSPPIEPG